MDHKSLTLFNVSAKPLRVRGTNGKLILAADTNRSYINCKKELFNVSKNPLFLYNEGSNTPFAQIGGRETLEIVCNEDWYTLGDPPALTKEQALGVACKPNPCRDECLINTEQLKFILDACKNGHPCPPGLTPEQLAIIIAAIRDTACCPPTPHVVTYDVAGRYTLNIAGGSTVTLTMTVVGGGGGGAAASATAVPPGQGGGGGGGGNKDTSVIRLSTPASLVITVGIGGAGGTSLSLDGKPGLFSQVVDTATGNILCYADAGQGGMANGVGGNGWCYGGGGAGPSMAGGIAIFGNGFPGTNLGGGKGGGYNPGNGALDSVTPSIAGGGGASSPYTGRGGNAAQPGIANPTTATDGTRGAGGGGGSYDAQDPLMQVGGNGGPGYVIISYIVE